MLIHGKGDFRVTAGGVQHESHLVLNIISLGERYYRRIVEPWPLTQNTLHGQPQGGHTRRHRPYGGQDRIMTIYRVCRLFIGEMSY